MEKIFHLSENRTTLAAELRAGVTTFFAMAYIIFLNGVFLGAAGMDGQAVLIATCLSAAMGTLLCAFLSNKPFALAAGMGLNSFFAYTVCGVYGYSWQQALALTFIAGLLFFLLAVSPFRRKVIASFPDTLKHAVSVGIGLFIALIGLLNAGVVNMTMGFPALGDLSDPGVLCAIAGILVTALLAVRGVKAALILGMLFTVILNVLFGVTAAPTKLFSAPDALGLVAFKLDFHGLAARGIPALCALLVSMAMVDMFDTLGFLIGADSGVGLLKDDEKATGRVLIADASSTMLGALLGCSTVTCYAESSTGIAAGGRTGLTGVTVAVCFLLATFFSPLSSVITAAATSPALVVVGLYMFLDIRNIDLQHLDEALPAYLCILVMPLSYSITTGMAVGFISYTLCKLACGKARELSGTVLALTVLFALYFII